MHTYVDFEVEVQPRTGDVFPVSVSGQAGDARGTLRLPTSDPRFRQLLGKLQALDTDEATLEQLGQMLFGALFTGGVRERYIASQSRLGQDEGLRLKLNIAASEAEVAALPWELLNDPDQGALALLDTSIVRYLPQPTPLPKLEAQLPLNVLITAANTPPATNIAAELREAQAALEGLGAQVKVTVEEHLTTTKLQRLLRGGFHVWHFIGHGSLSADGTTARLHFEDGAGGTDFVPASQLRYLFNRTNIRLVVLSACKTATLATEPFRSMAPALIRAQVPAVVAQQFSVPEESTGAFASEFYRALAEGFPIDACVNEGRKAVMGASGLGEADWAIPVVYTRAPDGQLFKLQGTTPPVVQPPSSGGVNVSIGNGNTITDSPININNGGQASVPPEPSEREQELASLRELRVRHKRTVQALKIQAATFGISTPPHITIQIEDTEKVLAQIEKQIRELGG